MPAVGDLHIENFGTWEMLTDGCVGVNDFLDEADELPYTNDLIRLATSTRLARAEQGAAMKLDQPADLFSLLTGKR